ncbi:hypothetical protein MYAM1_001155 [Malassezia yamatoensis]|uniref:Uncharacterized protein n=1 Tax=Malassezia yamatoensis TaxID=253288 RepID=A0AAJ6CH58_9BASI|nr:hypothetical protein MYAM1_001155 [Malassezia yamatoensis]
MATSHVFDMATIEAQDGLPVRVPYTSNDWDSSHRRSSFHLGHGPNFPQSRFVDQNLSHGVESPINPLMGGAPTNLSHTAAPDRFSASAQTTSQQQGGNTMRNVVPLHHSLPVTPNVIGTSTDPPFEQLSSANLRDPHISSAATDASYTDVNLPLATAPSLPMTLSSSAEIMNTPGGLRLTLGKPVTNTNMPLTTPVVVQPSGNLEAEQYLPKIGGLLEDLVGKAADAQALFRGAQYQQCSENLSQVRSRLDAISEIGVESLATAVEYQQTKIPTIREEHPAHQSASAFLSQQLASPVSPADKEKQLFTAALFSGVQSSPVTRKRANVLDLHEAPVKALRGEVDQAEAVIQRTRDLVGNGTNSTHKDASGSSSVFSPSISHTPVYDMSSLDSRHEAMQLPSGTPAASNMNRPSFFHEAASHQLLADNASESVAHTPQAVMSNLQLNTSSAAQPNMLSRSRANSMQARSASFLNGTQSEVATPQEIPLGSDTTLPFGLNTIAYSHQHSSSAWPENPTGNFSATGSSQESPTAFYSSRQSSDGADDTMANASNGNLQTIALPQGGDSSVDESWESMAQLDKLGGSEIPSELRKRLDEVFHEFLNILCSNLDATDDRGEPVHQTLMPKKMARLDESPDFRPFKFRIQAFTNAFQSELVRRGLHEGICSIKKIKQYLWTQPYISRFNEDGKKAKSKGNHIWNIEAKKLPEGGWTFRTFSPKIAGSFSRVAHVNERWTWNLRIWDPQASSSSIKVVYTANTLPSWIRWEDNEKVLTGIPQGTNQSGEVSVTALYVHLGQLHRLEHSFFLKVLPPSQEANSGSVSEKLPNGASSRALDSESLTTDENLVLSSMVGTNHGNGPVISMPIPGGNLPETPFERESMKYEVVEPSRAPDLLNSIPFPFTPPVYMDARAQYIGMEHSQVAQNSDSFKNTQPFALSNNTTPLYPRQPMSNMPQPSPMHQTAVFVGHDQNKSANNASSKTLPQNLMAQDPVRATQLWNTIEQRQQNQVASLMLSIPDRRPNLSMSEHSGQRTPISNMPSDIGATLPTIHSHPSAGS